MRVGTTVVVAVTALACLVASLAGAAAPAPRSLAAKCGDTSGVDTKPFWLVAKDGVRLYAIESGAGKVGVVLAHESPADLCGWLPYVADLRRSGIRVLAFDFRGFGDSQRPAATRTYLAYGRDFSAAVARLRADGARKVFLMGASFGGAAALTYAPGLPLAGVVSLSGETQIAGAGLDGLAAVRRLRAPLLLVGSREDRYLSVADALKLLHRAGSRDKRTALYPGAFHGWQLVEDAPYAARVRALVLAWLRSRSTS
ncbi:MAG TPA: alpha/beta fold hydrolase [Gaiellaceae bacterium]|jgi:alpha-beta hydrolase superfamily lysophospholipase